jgi:integral membrane protein
MPEIMQTNNSMNRFRIVAITEGISFLILLFIAMPLKYFLDIPQAVLYTGWIHGVLFITFCVLLLDVKLKYRWNFKKVLIAFVASLLPFGTFILDNRILKKEALKT